MPLDPKDSNLNKVLTGAIIGLLSWNIFTTHKLAIQVAVLVNKVDRIERQLNDL
jgi:hypothetical protein